MVMYRPPNSELPQPNQQIHINRQKYRVQFEDYYSKCFARNSNTQIHYDLSKLGIFPPSYDEKQIV